MRPERQQLQPLRSGAKRPKRLRGDADRVPRADVDELIAELHAARAADDHVHLLVLLVAVPELPFGIGAEPLVADADALTAEILPCEPGLEAVREAEFGRHVLDLLEVLDRVAVDRRSLAPPEAARPRRPRRDSLCYVPRARAGSQIIARRGDLVVERDPLRPSGRLLRQDDMDASYVDLADPTHLEFDYLRWMRIVLRSAHARRILHVGGGACALPRALAAADPGGRQEVCEVDAGALALAREHLGLRRAPGLRVRQADGRAFVAGQPDASWDAIVIDAFVGATVPRRLITRQAFADVARVAPLALVNVVDNRAGRDVRLIAAGLAHAFQKVWAFGGSRGKHGGGRRRQRAGSRPGRRPDRG